MARIHLRLFGGFDARLQDGRAAELRTRKAEGLLAYLASRPGEAYSRERLAAMFWGDAPESAARHSLRQALASVRGALRTDTKLLHTDRDNVRLEASAVAVDVVAFEELGNADTTESLIAAGDLYRGALLEGFNLREEPFENWLARERDRLHARALQFSLRLAELARDGPTVASALHRAIELDPLCEEGHRRLMHGHIAAGNYSAAIRQYNACAELLRRELDTVPEARTTALYRTAAAAGARGAAPATLTEPEASRGERKVVTVVCIALSPLADTGREDPEQSQETLRPILDTLRAVALRNGGAIVSEAQGELIAIFGAPVARENHAADACRAASEMIVAIGERPDMIYRPSLAIDSGEVVVRTRDEALLPAEVFGHCIRRAAGLARTGRVRIGATDATVSLACRFWRFSPLDAVSLDPQSPAIPLHAPTGPSPVSIGLDHVPAQLLSRFIGRRAEIVTIAETLALAAEGQGQMIAAVGEPGIGKSRLFHEFIQSVDQQWQVVLCRAIRSSRIRRICRLLEQFGHVSG